jgi:RNA polymerase sigma-70 factor (ECF subfamily)
MEEGPLTHAAAHQEPDRRHPAPASWNPEKETARRERTAVVHEALGELSESYRRVIELRDLQEQSTKEVADQLGITRVNVRVRLHRARQALEDALEGRFGGGNGPHD